MSTGPNAQQIEYWNQTAGPTWVEVAETIERQIEPLGREAMERLGVRRGQRVLDVGCGCGQTSLQLAERVGTEGGVLGADISRPMLELARARSAAAGAGQVGFEEADAQVHPFEPEAFDLAFSRFGVMFFADPRAAFANLLRALAPGGRIGFACWQAIADNPWMLRPAAALAPFVELPPPPPPDAPGPFAFADAGRVCAILEDAGFACVGYSRLAGELTLGPGADLDATVRFLLRMGPAGAALRGQPPEVLDKAAGAVRDAIAPFATDVGVRMPFAAWVISGSRRD